MCISYIQAESGGGAEGFESNAPDFGNASEYDAFFTYPGLLVQKFKYWRSWYESTNLLAQLRSTLCLYAAFFHVPRYIRHKGSAHRPSTEVQILAQLLVQKHKY